MSSLKNCLLENVEVVSNSTLFLLRKKQSRTTFCPVLQISYLYTYRIRNCRYFRIYFIVNKKESNFQRESLGPGPQPKDLYSSHLISLVTPVLFDTPKWGHEFGDCLRQPVKVAGAGDTVTAKFVSLVTHSEIIFHSLFFLFLLFRFFL